MCDLDLAQEPGEAARVEALCKSADFSCSPMLEPAQSLTEVIAQDRAALQRLGVTAQQVADRLREFRIRMSRSRVEPWSALAGMLGRPMPKYGGMRHIYGNDSWSPQHVIEDRVGDYRVTLVSWGGAQGCPFQRVDDAEYHGYEYGADDLVVHNLKTGEHVAYSSLLPHMIAAHGFFEGRGRYRLEPADAVRVLEIQPGVDYAIPQREVLRWRAERECSCCCAALAPGAEQRLTSTHRLVLDGDALLAHALAQDAEEDDLEIWGAQLEPLEPSLCYRLVKQVRREYVF